MEEEQSIVGIVGDLIDFKPREDPPWHKKSEPIPDIDTMVQDIVRLQMKFQEFKKNKPNVFNKVREDFIYKYIFWLKGQGTEAATKECIKSAKTNGEPDEPERKYSTEIQKTINTYNTYVWLEKNVNDNEEKEDYGLLDSSLVITAHKKIMNGLELGKTNTKPGIYSKEKRLTSFKGEQYEYQQRPAPGEMEKAVQTKIDHHNSLIEWIKTEKNNEVRTLKFFKACSSLLFHLLDLHPFSDGNGRLCRLLCNYALSSFISVPTPIYNGKSNSTKNDYVEALVDARKQEKKHPEILTTMLIESSWFACHEFFEQLDSCK